MGDGKPIQRAVVEVTAISRALGASARQLAPVTPDERGRFSFTTPPGSSRRFTFAYRPFTSDASPAATSQVTLNVRAGVKLEVVPRLTTSRGRISFSGRLLGGPNRAGTQVQLFAVARRGRISVPVATLRADRRGRFHLQLPVPPHLRTVYVLLPGGRAAPEQLPVRHGEFEAGERADRALVRRPPGCAAAASSRGRTGSRSGAGCARGSGSCPAGRRTGSARASARGRSFGCRRTSASGRARAPGGPRRDRSAGWAARRGGSVPVKRTRPPPERRVREAWMVKDARTRRPRPRAERSASPPPGKMKRSTRLGPAGTRNEKRPSDSSWWSR